MKELYVVPFPGPGGKRQISSGGAINGFWTGNGKEMIYVTLDYKLIAVEFHEEGSTFQTGSSFSLFGGRPVPFSRAEDNSRGGGIPITHDGKRLLFPVALQGDTPEALTLLTNWQAQLRK